MAKNKSVAVFEGIENYEKFSIAEVCAGALDRIIDSGEAITLHGGTGIGKTAIGEPIAKRLGRVFKYTQPAAYESVDFAGMPEVDKAEQVVKFVISEMLKFDPKKKYLWLIDELNRAMPDVRQVLLGLFNKPGYIGSHKIPDNVSIMVAVNSASIQSGVNVGENESAQISRTANIYVYTTLKDTIEYFKGKYSANNFFMQFLQSDFAKKIIANDFSTEWSKGADEILLVPRILEKATAVCEADKTLQAARDNVRLVSAFIGVQAKTAYIEFLAECETLNPAEFFLPKSKVLAEVFKRPKTSENSTLILTAASSAMNELSGKNPDEQMTLFRNIQTLFNAGWGEVVGACLAKCREINDTALRKLLVSKELSDVARFFIDYSIESGEKKKADDAKK